MEGSHIHQTTYDDDGVRRIRYWNHLQENKKGFRVLPKAGDGLRICKRDKVCPGYVLYSPDHSNQFYLIDLDGRIVHEWPASTSHFGYLLPNGNLIYDTEFSADLPSGVRELDWHGEEVWFHECPIHHDFQRLPNGNTLLLCQKEIEEPEIYDGSVLDSYLSEVTPDGDEVWHWNSCEHRQELIDLLGITFPRDHGDWTHTNTVQEVPETRLSSDPRFKPGNVLISHRDLDTAAVIDKATGEIVWAWGPGVLDFQHMTNFLPSGNLIVFDNGPHRGYSVVREIDPLTGNTVWEYKGDPPESFWGKYLSGQVRLSNGNTFICSGSAQDWGRMFEVTPEGEIVWDFQNPYAEQAEGELPVYRAYKYDKEFIEQFL